MKRKKLKACLQADLIGASPIWKACKTAKLIHVWVALLNSDSIACHSKSLQSSNCVCHAHFQ